MKLELKGKEVTIRGELDREGNCAAWSMPLEQYEKHARDPEFVKAAGADHAKIMAARQAELEAIEAAKAKA